MTNLQEFMRAGGTLDALKTDLGITTRRHAAYPNLVCFRYDQIDSPEGHPIVREARGIILDESCDWEIVSRAFDRFFNHGQGHADEIDWTTARVQEKADGSLAVLYPYDGTWHVATKGTPDASGNINGNARTFKEYFWVAFERCGLTLPPCVHQVCFYFELTGPLNRIVVPHAETSLTLLGARSVVTSKELTVDEASAYFPGVNAIREFPLSSVDDIVASFESISPLSQEGYVVVDAAFRRVKIKHPGYVALHHAKDGLGTKAFVEIARSGETSEVLLAFPEFAPLFEDAKSKVDSLILDIESDYERLRGIETQKAFAAEATKTRHSAALFCIRSGKAESARAYVRGMVIGKLVDALGMRDETAAVEPA